MSKDSNRLTAKKVAQLNKPGRYHDGFGLYLQITKRGSRSWLLRYEHHGAAHMLGLGPLRVVGLAEARARAKAARLQLLDGLDPVGARRAQRAQKQLQTAQGVSFKQCAERFLAAHEAAWRNGVHRGQWRTTLATYVFPIIGDLPVAAIDTDLVLKVLEPIWATKQVTAKRLRGRIERILDWARARELRSGENPARWRGHLDHLLAKPATIKRHLAALPFAEVPEFMTELRQPEDVPARALELIILTAARASEALGARWSEIDLPNRVWTIPPERMKAGREHRVPLSDRVIHILDSLPREKNNDRVFISARPSARLASATLLKLLREMRPGVTVHGFRSAFRDWAGEHTHFPREVAEAALAHVVGDETERAYRRGTALEKRREMIHAWARYCAEEPQTGTVIEFSKG